MKRLLIFLKYPIPGQVKTRLARVVGAKEASDIYRVCSELTLERLQALSRMTVVCLSPPEAMSHARAWLGSRWKIRPQQGANLGERLAEATNDAFLQGARELVVIGTDSPWLGIGDINAAFMALRRTQLVIGPTHDGGYYLIGLSKPAPGIFEGVEWGSASVYAQTMKRAGTLGLSATTLPSGYDVDYIEDVERFIAEELGKGDVPVALQTMAEAIRTDELDRPGG